LTLTILFQKHVADKLKITAKHESDQMINNNTLNFNNYP